MLKAIARVLAWPLLALVWLYRLAVSPWLGNNCRYDPSCSNEYATGGIAQARLRFVAPGSRGTTNRRRWVHPSPWGGSRAVGGYRAFRPGVLRVGRRSPGDNCMRSIDEPRNRCEPQFSITPTGSSAETIGRVVSNTSTTGLEQDPDPDDAWSWFFDQMMLWEIKEPALIFAQSYLTRLLHDGDYAKAVKVMTRCQHVNESFLPLADDRELAREAAEACGNEDLVGVLELCDRPQ